MLIPNRNEGPTLGSVQGGDTVGVILSDCCLCMITQTPMQPTCMEPLKPECIEFVVLFFVVLKLVHCTDHEDGEPAVSADRAGARGHLQGERILFLLLLFLFVVIILKT